MATMASICKGIWREMFRKSARPIPTLRLCRSVVSGCDGESEEAARQMVSSVFWSSFRGIDTGERDGGGE
jgi:hypothetical protein